MAVPPGIDLEKVISVASEIMKINPELPWSGLMNTLCEKTAFLIDARAATCRVFDTELNTLLAAGEFNWKTERSPAIPSRDTVAGTVISTLEPYSVPDIASEELYLEKEKVIAAGLNSLLALPIQLIDYVGAEKKNVLIGSLQLYFEEKNNQPDPLQIKLLRSLIERFNYVLALKRRLEIQKRSEIIRDSRKALIGILKRTRLIDQVLSYIVAKIAEVIDVNRCSLFNINRDAAGNGFAVLIAGFPLKPMAHTYGITLTFQEHPAFLEVCEAGEPLIIRNAQQDPRMKANYGLYIDRHIQNVCFVPIKDDSDTTTHVLVLDGDESKPLTAEDIFFINALIDDVELCIQASILSQQRHDFMNRMISFGAIARVYTKKQAAPDTTPEEIEKLFKKLNKSMLAVNDIIADRIPFAEKECFNLHDVIAERLEAYYFGQDIRLQESCRSKELFITADTKKVGRIIGNLLDNAHKKLESLKAGVLEVKTYLEGEFAVISIGNTGVLPPEACRMLDDNIPIQHQKREGSLGLSIVRLFTLMHNGFFEYETSAEYNWTVFRVKLPVGGGE